MKFWYKKYFFKSKGGIMSYPIIDKERGRAINNMK